MKRKHLESCLSSLPNRVFSDPKIHLEQYPTSVHLTASIVITALSKNDAGPGVSVLDLGCGTGMLGLGFAMVKSDFVYLVDCDEDALALARENVNWLVEEELIGSSCEDEEDGCCFGAELIAARVNYEKNMSADSFNSKKVGSSGGKDRKGRGGGGRGRGRVKENTTGIQKKTSSMQCNPQSTLIILKNCTLTSNPDVNEDDGIPLPSKVVDTVITNPPFGTKNNEGIDVQFLRTAIRLARRAVYSFHKTSTRPFLVKLLRERWGLNVEVVAEMKFDIPNMYKFHKKKNVDVGVDLIRVFWSKDEIENVENGNGDGSNGPQTSSELDGSTDHL